tara:strand:+ start:813 stop:1058 length:246 start_codon:yes stop_codon:yes gene_type:complete
MYKNTTTSENTPDTHKVVITSQIDDQLAQIANEDNVDNIKTHFEWVLMNDFYKNELSSDKITEMESYLDADYADKFEDLPS